MGKIKPFFITGANAKILLNNKTLAYCTDVSYSVQIIHKTPKVLGMYEGTSVEPLGYNVSGSFQIVRYARHAIDDMPGGVSPNPNESGNGAGNWGSAWTGSLGGFAARNGIGNDGRANEALDPSRFSNSTTFDIQIYQKIGVPLFSAPNSNFLLNSSKLSSPSARALLLSAKIFAKLPISSFINTATDILSGGNPKIIGSNLIGVANIRNCRITQADFSLSKKGVAVQRFSFVALYIDEDSFAADFSGTSEHFI